MTFQLSDLVFQNDRYYLLFNDLDAKEIVLHKKDWQIFINDGFYEQLHDCKLSEEIKVDDKVILETFQNLNKLENVFRKLRSVVIIDNSGNK